MLTDPIPSPTLTPRERQCLTYLARGLSGKELADRIGISIKTAEKQIASACKRVGATTREQAVAIAVTLNLIPAVVPLRKDEESS